MEHKAENNDLEGNFDGEDCGEKVVEVVENCIPVGLGL